MKKGIVLFSLLGIAGLFSFCSEKKMDDAACLANDPNPNKSSELAILMRHMATHAEQAKKEVLAGQLRSSFPSEFKKIHTAVPTDDHIKGDAFDGFADGYLKNLELLYTPGENLLTKYNAVINTCIGCHESSCPGPLVRINKMKIEG